MNRLLSRSFGLTAQSLGVRSPGYGPARRTTGKRTGQLISYNADVGIIKPDNGADDIQLKKDIKSHIPLFKYIEDEERKFGPQPVIYYVKNSWCEKEVFFISDMEGGPLLELVEEMEQPESEEKSAEN